MVFKQVGKAYQPGGLVWADTVSGGFLRRSPGVYWSPLDHRQTQLQCIFSWFSGGRKILDCAMHNTISTSKVQYTLNLYYWNIILYFCLYLLAQHLCICVCQCESISVARWSPSLFDRSPSVNCFPGTGSTIGPSSNAPQATMRSPLSPFFIGKTDQLYFSLLLYLYLYCTNPLSTFWEN